MYRHALGAKHEHDSDGKRNCLQLFRKTIADCLNLNINVFRLIVCLFVCSFDSIRHHFLLLLLLCFLIFVFVCAESKWYSRAYPAYPTRDLWTILTFSKSSK